MSLIDNYLFGLFIQEAGSEEIIKGLVERMLDVKIRSIHLKEHQHEISNEPNLHGVKLDAFLEDDEKTLYNIEVQVVNTKNIPKRMRYYQSMIDREQMPSGEFDYNVLPKTIIIFITDFDLFDKGFYRYTFENVCLEDKSLSLNDESIKVVLNTKGTVSDGVKPELVELLEYFRSSTKETVNKVSSGFIKQLDDILEPIKNSPKFGGMYMSFQEYMYESNRKNKEEGYLLGRQEGKQEGVQKERQETIEKFRKMGMTEEQIESFYKS
ncbi:MAG: Rpn family recombination-promoting nuclease/putative transposase [Ruminiclostridium sp.]|nr:Rpn family recombination-promoting nuclease/putative transposase [Ruminiclostridium sp.]